jgi:HSP20 family protein
MAESKHVEKKQPEKGQEEQSRGLAPWWPFGELEPWPTFGPFSGRMSRLMDQLFRESRAGGGGQAFAPAVDVDENDERYKITVELPGSKKEDVHVDLHEGMLTIRGEKKSEREETKDRRRYTERSYGSFSRSFTLPGDADADRVDAQFKDGVLTISIPKTEEAKPKPISIKGG